MKGLGGILSQSGSVKRFEFLRLSTRQLRNLCFALLSVLYWTVNKKFVDIAQQCFAFTPCVQFKSKFKSWRILTRFHQGLFKSLGLYYFHHKDPWRSLSKPLTYCQWTYHEHNVSTLWTYCEETADLKFWFTTSTVKIREEASSGSRPRRQKERGNYIFHIDPKYTMA